MFLLAQRLTTAQRLWQSELSTISATSGALYACLSQHLRGWLVRSMPAGSICGSRVRYAGYGSCLTCYYSQCRSGTTSTVLKAPLVCAWLVKRRYIKYPALPLPLTLTTVSSILYTANKCWYVSIAQCWQHWPQKQSSKYIIFCAVNCSRQTPNFLKEKPATSFWPFYQFPHFLRFSMISDGRSGHPVYICLQGVSLNHIITLYISMYRVQV